MTLEKIIELDKKYYMNTFGDRTPVAFEKGEGITLTSVSGEKYYDFMGGIAVSSLGHGNKTLVEAMKTQAEKLIHTSSLYYIENQAVLAQLLCENTFADKVFFCNSGAEANEGAIKLARKYFYEKGISKCEIICLKNSFHGRTLTTVSATGQEKYQKPYAPLTEKFVFIERNNIDELKNAVNENTAAIMIEFIQGESGVHPLDADFVNEIRKICDEKDILMIADEVQTGVGRCGNLYCYMNYGVEPDILTSAKGLGGGVPIGAVLAKDSVCAFKPGDHGTTFGGNPFCCACGIAVMKELYEGGVLENVKKVSAHFFGRLEELKSKYPAISEVRGAGLMVGIEFSKNIGGVIRGKLFEKKILTGSVADKILRVLPPLVLTCEEADIFVDTLGELLDECL